MALIAEQDLARILAAKIAGDEPDIILTTVTEASGQLLSGGPYVRVDFPLEGGVALVQQSSLFWESVSNIIDSLFKNLPRFRNRERPLPRIPTPPPTPRIPLPLPRPLPPRKGDETMEYLPPITSEDIEAIILRRY